MLQHYGMCQSEVLCTILFRMYYKHWWTLHEVYTEAVERLFLQKYFQFEVLEELQEARPIWITLEAAWKKNKPIRRMKNHWKNENGNQTYL